jgi:hypothetical protein
MVMLFGFSPLKDILYAPVVCQMQFCQPMVFVSKGRALTASEKKCSSYQITIVADLFVTLFCIVYVVDFLTY